MASRHIERFNAAGFTKQMACRAGIEPVVSEIILAGCDAKLCLRGKNMNETGHIANAAVAAYGLKHCWPVKLERDRTTMAATPVSDIVAHDTVPRARSAAASVPSSR